MSKPVIIIECDSMWPVLYKRERRRIKKALGQKVLAIEHIGSTAVPGLGAKPIIDIMVGVNQPEDAEDCVPNLINIGYNDITPQLGNPNWYYCLGKGLNNVYFHVHLVRFKSEHWERHLLFRDYLRSHPDVAQQYYDLKSKLAIEHRTDRQTYTESKTSFIEAIVAQARQEKIADKHSRCSNL